MEITAAHIAAVAGVASLILQVWNPRFLQRNRFVEAARDSLVKERRELLNLDIPKEFQEVAQMINEDEEFSFLQRNLDTFVQAAQTHTKMYEPLVDLFDVDIREFVDSEILDFRNQDARVNSMCEQLDSSQYYGEIDEFRQLACRCLIVVDAVRDAMLKQADRFSDRLSYRPRRRWAHTHTDFDHQFYIDPRIRRGFDPNWRDWP